MAGIPVTQETRNEIMIDIEKAIEKAHSEGKIDNEEINKFADYMQYQSAIAGKMTPTYQENYDFLGEIMHRWPKVFSPVVIKWNGTLYKFANM